MVLVSEKSKHVGFYIHGKVGTPAGCGFARCSHAKCGDPGVVSGVYQKKITNDGYGVSRMRYYRPTNPQSTAQEANRTKFANAMSAWSALTAPQKEAYTERAKKRNMFGWGLFIREYYQSI